MQIAVINPFKTLQKPLEAILKPSKGFSLSATHPKPEAPRSHFKAF